MSLISNVSSRVSDSNVVNSARNFLNTPAKKVIVLVAVAVIIALGVYLLRRCCPCLRLSAKTASPQLPVHPQQGGGLGLSQPHPSDSTAPLQSTNPTSPISTAAINTDPAGVPHHIFKMGYERGATHFQRHIAEDGNPVGWNIIYDYEDKGQYFPDSKDLPRRIEITSLDKATWISVDDVIRVKGLNMVNFVTDPSQVSDYAFEYGALCGTTHYRELQDAEGNRTGWLLINDNEKTAYKVPFNRFHPDLRHPSRQWAFPADQTGWMSAEDVRSCRQQPESQPLPNSLPQHNDSSSSSEDFESTSSEEDEGLHPEFEHSKSSDLPAPSQLDPLDPLDLSLELSKSSDLQTSFNAADETGDTSSSSSSLEWFESPAIDWNLREDGYEEASVEHQGQTIQLLREDDGESVWQQQANKKWLCLKQADSKKLTATSRDQRVQPADLLNSLATARQEDVETLVNRQLETVRSTGHLPGLSPSLNTAGQESN